MLKAQTKLLFAWIFLIQLTSLANATSTLDEANKILSKMTLKQKIGQKLMLSASGWGVPKDNARPIKKVIINGQTDELKFDGNYIQDNNIGGIILFSKNIDNIEGVKGLTSYLQNSAQAVPVMQQLPLLIAIDQEGGSVSRFMGLGFVNFSGNMSLGAAYLGEPDYNFTQLVYQTIGNNLNYLGINTDLAPVVDVNSNPKNPVIGVRSFSDSPSLVAKLGLAANDGLEHCNIATSLKHFPGHGNTFTDSHTSLPLVSYNKNEAYNIDIYPFEQIIKHHQPDIVMIAHIQYPALDNTKIYSTKKKEYITTPATFSRKMQTELLRGKLGYTGVILSDAFNMAAITNYFNADKAVVDAFKAGTDIVLMPSDLDGAAHLIGYIESEVNNGSLSLAELNQSVRRILLLKLKLKQGARNLPKDCTTLAVPHDLEDSIADKSITLIKNTKSVLPLTPKVKHIHLIAPSKAQMDTMASTIDNLQDQGEISAGFKFSFSTMHAKLIESDGEKALINASDVVILANDSSTNVGSTLNSQSQTIRGEYKLMSYAHAAHKKTVFISLKTPYDVAIFDTVADAILLGYNTYGYPRSPTIPAIIRVIFDVVSPQGKLPVDIPYALSSDIHYHYGWGLHYVDKD